jgi:hypothetical protein
MKHALSIGVLLVAAALGCGRTTAQTGSESHFLDTCLEGNCGTGLSCICGTCTRTCTTSDDCSTLAKASTCVELADLPNGQNCSTSAVQPVCDVACSADADCGAAGSDLRCIDGVCRRIVPDLCTLPQDPGPCDAAFPKYWHDPATHHCVPFTYGGCGGNENRFDSLEACQLACNVASSDALTCSDVQSSIAASIESAEAAGNHYCDTPADCTAVPLDNACFHACWSPALPVTEAASVQSALQQAETNWCGISAELGCTPLVPPCPPPPQTFACVYHACAMSRDECPSTCECSTWGTSPVGDRSGCAGIDLYVPNVAGCSSCQTNDLYVLVANRGQTDFSGVVDIVPVSPDAGPMIAPFSQSLSIPSGDFVAVTLAAQATELRLRVSAAGDCNPDNDEFSGVTQGSLGCH